MKEKEYEIGGRIFRQRPLTLGQWKQLIEYLAGNEGDPIDVFGSPRALAIILREKDKPLKDKDIDALSAFLEQHEEGLTTLEVVDDFFDFSPMHSFVSKMAEIARKVRTRTPTRQDGSIGPSSPSPEGTSPSGTPSSGTMPLEKLWPG